MTPQEELATILRPAGGGLYLVSTGKAAQEAIQRRLYGVGTQAEVDRAWRDSIEKLATARGVLIATPSDVGAGFVRGANLGPQEIRARLMEDDPHWSQTIAGLGLIDLGDVFVVPQLLHDDMLSRDQRNKSSKAVYPKLSDAQRETLPVSPLSIAERAFELVLTLNPNLKVFALGGDHSNAWPVVRSLHRIRPGFGIVQPDAHTDLLQERLGVKYCFATWSFHANELIGRAGRMTQVGIRASGRDQAHWESTTGVRQFWAHTIRQDPAGSLDAVLAHVKATGVKGVYFSNDIDGTDSKYADATGTPEPDGLEPDWVMALIERLGREVGLVGGDVMEVAPVLTRTPESAHRTVGLAARYFRQTLASALGSGA